MQEKDSNTGLFKKVTIVSITEPVPGFKIFELDGNISYKAGQYLTLVHHGKYEEVRRSYSFTSAPALGEPMRIGVKRVENGFFSRRLVESAKPGDRLLTIGAAGRFTLPADMSGIQQVFFLAAGSGITPVFSLLKTVLHLHPHVKATLVYSNANPEKTLFLQELQTLQQEYGDKLHIEFLFSNSKDLNKARLYRDLLEKFVAELVLHPFNQVLFYVCGPESYMRMCSYVLQEARVPAEHIKKEDFIIQRIHPPRALPPDTGAHKVAIDMGDAHYHFEVPYGDTILQAAKKSGISLPYSCEVGRCGNCLARCTEGKVWHSYNEVLTDKELAQGMVLTCVAHPMEGDVKMVIG
ncbi:MAG: 2Fe-2S iron-sulfur cluster-binding protein [Chitinophagaceae bacterium]